MDTTLIREAIDMDEWRNSFYLPKDVHGNILWHSKDTIFQCKDILEEKMSYAIRRLMTLQFALDEVNKFEDN